MSAPPGRPPRAARLLLRALLPGPDRDEVTAAADEYFEHLVRSRGRGAARRWYWREALTAGPRLHLTPHPGGTPSMDSIADALGHLRRAARSLARAPGYTLATVLTLSLGIGATATAYSVVDGVLLEPLPYDAPHELVAIAHTAPGLDLPEIPHATGLHVLYEERARSFESTALYGTRDATLLSGGAPERVQGAVATPSLFRVLRADAALGRTFTPEEGRPDAPSVVILSDGLWRERFAADPDLVGRTVELDGVAHEVVGVMPPGFAFPSPDTRYWAPLVLDPLQTRSFGGFNFPGIARLADGATPEAAERELAPLLDEAAGRYDNLRPELLEQGRIAPRVRPFMETVVGDVRAPLWIVLSTVGFVLLIACTNVANLTLVRAEARQREMAVRRAMGAGTGDLLGRSLAESGLLAAAGAGIGLLLTLGGLELVRTLGGAYLPRASRIEVDGSVLLVTLGVTAGAALLFGLLPVLRERGARPAETLVTEGRGATGSRARHRVRHTLVAVQMAFAFVLLVGSGLMVRSFQELRRVDPGFRADGVLTFRLALPHRSYPGVDELTGFHRDLTARLEALPGVEAVGAVTRLPLVGISDVGPWTERTDLALPGEGRPMIQSRAATPGYFEALGIPLLRGRSLADDDADAGDRPVVVVSRRAAELVVAEGEAVGRSLSRGVVPSDEEGRWAEVVGVVGDVHYRGLTEEPGGVVYTPIRTEENRSWQARSLAYVIRAAVPPTSLVPAVRATLGEMDPTLPLADVRTMEQVERQARAHTTFTMVMLVLAASVGLILGAVGLYGVLAWVTARRTREIGVRMALGAEGGAVRAMVLRQGLAVAALGMAAGVGGALVTSRFLEGLLYGVGTADPWTYGAVALLLLAVSAAAVWLPARRASRVDVVEALRSE